MGFFSIRGRFPGEGRTIKGEERRSVREKLAKRKTAPPRDAAFERVGLRFKAGGYSHFGMVNFKLRKPDP